MTRPARLTHTSGGVYSFSMTKTQTFTADLTRMNTQLQKLGAVIDFGDGTMGIDPTKAPAALLSAYSGLMSFGYANGLI